LESVCWGNSTVGSNPTLSAILQKLQRTTTLLSGTARHYSVTLCAVNQLSKMEMLLGSIKVNLIPIPLPLSE
jgi:hypothetical protein